MATIDYKSIRLRKPSEPPLYCSFCGKAEHEVGYLVAGPTVFICNECVETCREIGQELLSLKVTVEPAPSK